MPQRRFDTGCFYRRISAGVEHEEQHFVPPAATWAPWMIWPANGVMAMSSLMNANTFDRCVRMCLAWRCGRYSRASAARSTFWRISSLTFGLRLITRETVLKDIPANSATSLIVAIPSRYFIRVPRQSFCLDWFYPARSAPVSIPITDARSLNRSLPQSSSLHYPRASDKDAE